MISPAPNKGETLVNQCLAEAFRPLSTERIADWAYRVIRLNNVEGEFKNLPYDVQRTPINTDMFDWWQDPTSKYSEYVIMKGSQDGRTLGAAICAAYNFANNPGNFGYFGSSKEEANRITRARFMPILRQADPSISDAIDLAGEAAVVKLINGNVFLTHGGTVPPASWPLRDIVIDEAAIQPLTEFGSTMELAAKRSEKQSGRKILIFSKPEIWPKYQANPRNGDLRLINGERALFTEKWMSGTQEVPMVPCPHCGGFQELTDEQFRAPARLLPGLDLQEADIDLTEIENNTWYECVHCAHPIYEKDKAQMVRSYRLEPAPLDPKEAKRRGFARPRMVGCDPKHPDITRYKRPLPGVKSIHTSDLYNITTPECSWGKIHRKKLAAQRDPSAWATYCKDCRGEPPAETTYSGELTDRILSRLKGAYKKLGLIDPLTGELGTPLHSLPIDPERLTVQIDYQEGAVGQSSYFPFTLTAFDDKDQIHVVDYGILKTLEDIADLLQIEFQGPSGKKGRITFGLMDSQHDTSTVLEFCQRPGVYGRLYPSAGVSRNLDIDRRDLTLKSKYGVPFWALNYRSSYWENQLYTFALSKWCELLDPNNRARLNGIAAARHAHICPRIFLPIDTCDDYYAQISNMHEAPVSAKDPTKGLCWQKIRSSDPNDYGDCLKLALILRRFFRDGENRSALAS